MMRNLHFWALCWVIVAIIVLVRVRVSLLFNSSFDGRYEHCSDL
jgi:hypothetical protein